MLTATKGFNSSLISLICRGIRHLLFLLPYEIECTIKIRLDFQLCSDSAWLKRENTTSKNQRRESVSHQKAQQIFIHICVQYLENVERKIELFALEGQLCISEFPTNHRL